MPPAQHSLHKSTQILLVSLRLNFLMYTSNLIFPKLSSCCFFQKMGAFCHFSVSDSVAQTRKLGIILDSSTFLHCKCILPPKYFSNSQTSFLLLFYSHKLSFKLLQQSSNLSLCIQNWSGSIHYLHYNKNIFKKQI